MKHCCVRAFEKINIALDALFVALWLLQAELQVLHTDLKLFLSLQIKILVLTSSRMNFAGWQQSRHWQLSLPLCILKGNPTLCLLWRRSLSSLSLLLFSASSVKILFWRASSRETAWSFTLLTWARGGSGRQMIRQNSSGSKNETSRDVCKARALLYLLPDVY